MWNAALMGNSSWVVRGTCAMRRCWKPAKPCSQHHDAQQSNRQNSKTESKQSIKGSEPSRTKDTTNTENLEPVKNNTNVYDPCKTPRSDSDEESQPVHPLPQVAPFHDAEPTLVVFEVSEVVHDNMRTAYLRPQDPLYSSITAAET